MDKSKLFLSNSTYCSDYTYFAKAFYLNVMYLNKLLIYLVDFFSASFCRQLLGFFLPVVLADLVFQCIMQSSTSFASAH